MVYKQKEKIKMSNSLFTTVPVPKFPRSLFNLSRPVVFAPRMHKEYPTEILEIIPGDGMKIHAECYAKSQPMIAPTFSKMDVAEESFFVPCWQLSNKFDDFITGGERGQYNEKMPFVYISAFYNWLETLLSSSFGVQSATVYNERLTKFQDIIEQFDVMRSIPFVVPDFILAKSSSELATVSAANLAAFQELNLDLADSQLRINLLPFAAVLKIWCEFYRDENLCEDLFEMYWDGAETGINLKDATGDYTTIIDNAISSWNVETTLDFLHALFGLKSRAWKKDYFTSALPFVQKGPDVMVPLGDLGFVGPATPTQTSGTQVSWHGFNPGETTPQPGNLFTGASSTTGNIIQPVFQNMSSIQDIRTAFKLEEMYEADGRFGNRYPENTLGQFGVRTPDSRLPRCQFLGANKQPVQIQQVVQQSATDSVTPQGNLAGISSSYGSNNLCKTYQTQHGFLICLTALRVHALYQQGIHPMFSRYDRTEYAWPRFAHLGEQAIYTKQLFVDDTVTEDEVFGYTPRYADYKSDMGSIHGVLKGSLNYWTMARRFGSKPVLNEEFIYGTPRQDAFVVTNHLQPCFIMEIDYHVKANRVLPFYGQPHM